MEEEKIWYSESQGKERDAEILGRYKTIIDYFAEDTRRAANRININMLSALSSDEVLAQDRGYVEKVVRILSSKPVRDFLFMEDTEIAFNLFMLDRELGETQ